MQLVLQAAYHPEREWMTLVAQALRQLRATSPGGGIDWVGLFLVYVLETQEPERAEVFQSVWREISEGGADLMTRKAGLKGKSKAERKSEWK